MEEEREEEKSKGREAKGEKQEGERKLLSFVAHCDGNVF